MPCGASVNAPPKSASRNWRRPMPSSAATSSASPARRTSASFLGSVLLETTRQCDAAAAASFCSTTRQQWRMLAYVRDGEIMPPDIHRASPCRGSASTTPPQPTRDRRSISISTCPDDATLVWPGTLTIKRASGYQSMYVTPFVFGARTVGCITLYFRASEPISAQRSELLVALAQQATLAIELTRLAHAAKDARRCSSSATASARRSTTASRRRSPASSCSSARPRN